LSAGTLPSAAAPNGISPPSSPPNPSFPSNPNGSFSSATQTVTHGDYLEQPTDPVRSGYAFLGWFSSVSGGSQWYFPTQLPTKSLTLYARWSSTTGIDKVVDDSSSTINYYDLQGRRVSHPEKGRLYIIICNGERRLTIHN
jgi:uncharacterized repeat protein (TIGR02543 family)